MSNLLDDNHQPSAAWSKLFKVQVGFFVAELFLLVGCFIVASFLIPTSIDVQTNEFLNKLQFVREMIRVFVIAYAILISIKYVSILILRKEKRWTYFFSVLGIWVVMLSILWKYSFVNEEAIGGRMLDIAAILFGLSHLLLIFPYSTDTRYQAIRLYIIYNAVCLGSYITIAFKFILSGTLQDAVQSVFFQFVAVSLIANITLFTIRLQKLNNPRFREFYLWIAKSFLWLLWVAVNYLIWG